ncbi:MAG TPA: PaaI family thioesterase, partial [bacterium]
MASVSDLQDRMKGLFGELLGVKLLEARQDYVKAELFVRDNLCTLPGRMHGGAMMAFADQLGAYGTVLNLPPGAGTTTIESK